MALMGPCWVILSQLSSWSGVLATGISVCLSLRSRRVSGGGRSVFLYVVSPHGGVARVVPWWVSFSDVPRLLLRLISVGSGVLGACFLFTTELEGRHLTLLGSSLPGKGRTHHGCSADDGYRIKQWVFFTASCGKQQHLVSICRVTWEAHSFPCPRIGFWHHPPLKHSVMLPS